MSCQLTTVEALRTRARDADVSEEMHDALTGHTSGGVGAAIAMGSGIKRSRRLSLKLIGRIESRCPMALARCDETKGNFLMLANSRIGVAAFSAALVVAGAAGKCRRASRWICCEVFFWQMSRNSRLV